MGRLRRGKLHRSSDWENPVPPGRWSRGRAAGTGQQFGGN